MSDQPSESNAILNSKNTEINSLKGNLNKGLFSSAEIAFDGDASIRAIEFRGISLVDSNSSNGLEGFFKMIDNLNSFSQHIHIRDKRIMLMYSGKSFSVKEDGTTRKVALVSIELKGKVAYIIEVEHSINTRLATLILCPISGNEVGEDGLAVILEQLIAGLLNNNGHWNESVLSSQELVRVYKEKHMEGWLSIDWAHVMLRRLVSLPFVYT